VNETNQCIHVPGPGDFEAPVRAWWWPYTDVTGKTMRTIDLPDFVHVMSTPVVARARGAAHPDDVPTVYFNTFTPCGSLSCEGVLRAVSGADGTPLWSVTDPMLRTNGVSSIAVGDLDGDGNVEIVTGGYDGTTAGLTGGLLAFHSDGTLMWKAPDLFVGWGGPAIADMDGDGKPEVIIGNIILNGQTGAQICSGGYTGTGDNGEGPLSVVEDIDGDGQLEVVTGNMAYKMTRDPAGGVALCDRFWPQNLHDQHGNMLFDGFAAVAQIVVPADTETYTLPVIAVSSRGTVRIQDWTGGLVMNPVKIPGGGTGGGPPTIADFDGSGTPQIGVAGQSSYTVFKPGVPGNILWTTQTQDGSSAVTGSSVFDFYGAGRPQVIYNDECYIHIYDGPTGRELFNGANSSCTAYEMPVVADVDGTGAAGLLVPSNSVCNINCPWGNHLTNGFVGLSLYVSPSDSWVGSRAIWNEHTYHLTNVDDFGGIPAQEPRSWGPNTLNSFRQNYQGVGTFNAPDLTISDAYLDGTACPQSLTVNVLVTNIGARGVRAGVPVAFYEETDLGRNLLGVVTIPKLLDPGDQATVTFTWNGPPRVTPTKIVAAVDDDGTGVFQTAECNTANNSAEIDDVICRDVG
jgi:hypothetical protein